MSRPTRAGGLMVCGTGSDAGKSTVVSGLCRLLARRGMRVAPFKAQNMALNSAVTASGHEIGRAQAAQAMAAGVEAEVSMNPILLKPTDHRTSQVVVRGRPWATLDAVSYHARKADLWPVVEAALDDLRRRFDVVICEGAGSPAEINLLDRDITNLRVAAAAGFPAVLVGDIDRGGVFASLYGTVSILPAELAGLIRGFVINKFRGDPALLSPGLADLERRTGIPTFGVLPWIDGPGIDAEDSLALRDLGALGPMADGSILDVAAIRLPRISNFTDLEALGLEPTIRLRLVERAGDLGRPDLVVLPGSKSTVVDLAWLRRQGLDGAIADLAGSGRCTVLGVCAGYQMLGRRIEDGVESSVPTSPDGLGLLPVSTLFQTDKLTRRLDGTALDQPVRGYQIHHGRVTLDPGAEPWIEGARAGAVFGTTVHGLFENDGFRRAFLQLVADRAGVDWVPGPPVSFDDARQSRFDDLADALEAHVDIDAILSLLKAGCA